MTYQHRCTALLLAGGIGERMRRAGGKQLALIEGKPVVAWALAALDATPSVDAIVLVRPEDAADDYVRLVLEPSGCSKPVAPAPSGQTRQASLAAGLSRVPDETEVVVVHDGARPLITPELVQAAIDTLCADPRLDGVVVGHPSIDTVKEVDGREVVRTPDRARIWAAQTPQVFRAAVLRRALSAAESEGFIGTDDSSLVERVGGRIRMLEGPRENLKVTMPEDLTIAAALLAHRKAEGR